MKFSIMRFITYLLLVTLVHCKADTRKNDDLMGLMVLSQILGSGIKFSLSGDASSASRTLPRAIDYPSEFTDSRYQQNVIPLEDFGMDVSVFLVWKSEALGGVAYGEETIENADKVLLDIGATIYGPNAASKMAFTFGQWDIFKSLYGWHEDDSKPIVTFAIDKAWKDPSYDRLGLVIHSFTYLFDKHRFNDPIYKMAKIQLRHVIPNQSNASNEGQSFEESISKSSIGRLENPVLPTSPEILNMETPCQTMNPNIPDIIPTNQHIYCGMQSQTLLAVNPETGSALPSKYMITSAYTTMSENGLIDLNSAQNQTSFNSHYDSAYRLPEHKYLSVVGNPATVHSSTNKSYETSPWKENRLLVLPIPNSESQRNSLEIVVDKDSAFFFQSDFGISNYEPIQSPKFKYDFKGPEKYTSVSLDTQWTASNGIYYENWPKTPTAASQIHPNAGKKFGYFLPRISVKVK